MPENEMQQQIKALLTKSVQRSGFPFQAKIQHILESKENWEVVCAECSWRRNDREEFIDIIARQNNIHLVIECKKSSVLSETKNSHGLSWPVGASKRSFVFLCRNAKKEITEETHKTLVTYCREEDYDDAPDAVYGAQAEEWCFEPLSYEASMCVTVDVENPKEMLERELSSLVRGCHEYAKSMYSFLFGVGAHITEIFIPVFVTTSPLYILKYDPNHVAVEDGEYQLDANELHSVPWVRFRKSLMAEHEALSDERTVIVVEARYFEKFLEEFKVVPVQQESNE
jgi:hypothetical protein